jgi:uncharacterized protein (TIGR02646 family)
MIFVEFDRARIPDAWNRRAAKVIALVENAPDDDARRKIIESNRKLWKDIKKILADCSFGKCWYSEAKDLVSDWQVDHFRPKSKYQWLAFSWQNFRLAGCKPNRRKTDEFPLLTNCKQATWADRCCDQEAPAILDPVVRTDPSLLTFNENGRAAPSDEESEYIVQRVAVTIELLDLNADDLASARARKWRECRDKIQRYRREVRVPMTRVDPERRRSIEELLEEIMNMSKSEEPFAGTVRACMRAHGLSEFILSN